MSLEKDFETPTAAKARPLPVLLREFAEEFKRHDKVTSALMTDLKEHFKTILEFRRHENLIHRTIIGNLLNADEEAVLRFLAGSSGMNPDAVKKVKTMANKLFRRIEHLYTVASWTEEDLAAQFAAAMKDTVKTPASKSKKASGDDDDDRVLVAPTVATPASVTPSPAVTPATPAPTAAAPTDAEPEPESRPSAKEKPKKVVVEGRFHCSEEHEGHFGKVTACFREMFGEGTLRVSVPAGQGYDSFRDEVAAAGHVTEANREQAHVLWLSVFQDEYHKKPARVLKEILAYSAPFVLLMKADMLGSSMLVKAVKHGVQLAYVLAEVNMVRHEVGQAPEDGEKVAGRLIWLFGRLEGTPRKNPQLRGLLGNLAAFEMFDDEDSDDEAPGSDDEDSNLLNVELPDVAVDLVMQALKGEKTQGARTGMVAFSRSGLLTAFKGGQEVERHQLATEDDGGDAPTLMVTKGGRKRVNPSILCDCGGHYTKSHKAEHKRSNKHREWAAKREAERAAAMEANDSDEDRDDGEENEESEGDDSD